MLLAQISLIVFVLFLSYHDQCDGKSHYDTLGVSRGSSGKVITKKYRELAKKLHPDKNKHDPGAQEKFIEVSEAYEVLSNVNSRKDYDYELKFGGSNWSNQHQNNHNRRGNGGFHNFNNEEVFFFRGPDGRIFTTSARNQVTKNLVRKHPYQRNYMALLTASTSILIEFLTNIHSLFFSVSKFWTTIRGTISTGR